MTLALASSAAAAEFPAPYNSEPESAGAPMPPAEAAAGFQMPPGFQVQLFAAEPAVQNPIAMAWDGRGRLWIAENYTYAEAARKFDLALRDRVLIFEDRDGDGRADGRKLFTDNVQRLTGLEVGRGGVWLLCPPQLLFLPDRDGDDVPDAEPLVVLDGFTVARQNYHNFANGLRWGPDGWLYGRCGASCPGLVGPPGTDDERRIPLHGGLWRWHPRRATFEVLSHGTTNPWGHDWNEHGEAFFVNTVNGHLWHAITGAHFRRPHTQTPNRHVYEPLEMHADHWHWDTGQNWWDSRSASGEHDLRGGGHAHSGCLIYQGENWPAEYRGRLLTLNLHGRRMNVERLERAGSGYVARHEPDIFQAADRWFRGIELSSGPDGGVYVLDWSDSGECHEHTGVHRLSGRIYKLTYGTPPPAAAIDLARADTRQLTELLGHRDQWYVRQARRELLDRVAAERDLELAREELRACYEGAARPQQQLEALWTLHAIGGAEPALLRSALRHDNEHLRAWAVRLLVDHLPLDTVMSARPADEPLLEASDLAALVELAAHEPSGLVRLALASALQRLPVEQRVELAQPLCARSEDAADPNLPWLLWYGLIPVAHARPELLVPLARSAAIPCVRQSIARCLVERIEPSPQSVNALLELAVDGPRQLQADVLEGLAQGLAGWRRAPRPEAWGALQTALHAAESPAIRDRARELSVVFGDDQALDEVRRIARDGGADLDARRAALELLIRTRPDDLQAVCQELLTVRSLNTIAIRGLAGVDDPQVAASLAASYGSFQPDEQPAVVETLVSRASFARALLAAMAEGTIPRAALSPFQVRQIHSLNDPELTTRLGEVWGRVRETDAEKQRAIDQLRAQLSPSVLATADKSRGRKVYQAACGSCHQLYGQGGTIGPDLTGAGRHDLSYVLSNVIDPSAAVTADYRLSVLTLHDGRVLNGVVAGQTGRTITLQTAQEKITIERAEMAQLQSSELSLMPDGLLDRLAPDEIRDLVAYLLHPTQVPLPEEPRASQP